MADLARKRATYGDLEGVPEQLVAEIVDGEVVTSPRPRHDTRGRRPAWEASSMVRSTAAGEDPEAGSFWTSPSCTCRGMLSFLILGDGVANACRCSRR